MRSKVALLGFVLTAGLSVAACDIQAGEGGLSFDIASGKAQDTWTRTYTLPAEGRLELINVNGRITAEPAEGSQVIVEAKRTAKGSTDEAAKELLAKLEIREEVSEACVRVESRPLDAGGTVDIETVNGGVSLGLTSDSAAERDAAGGW